MNTAALYHAHAVRTVLQAAAHLALWAGLYVTGAVLCLAQLVGLEAAASGWLRGAAFAFCTAAAVYLLDRVKLRDAWLDPADAQAHPARFAFLTAHSTQVRVMIVALLGAATWLGAGLLTFGAAVPLFAAVGVLVYAGWPRGVGGRPRPKDIVLLKNAYVAAGITGFATVVALAMVGGRGGGLKGVWTLAAAHAAPLAFSAAHLAARVFADAVLCDLDDEEADRRHGTGTLPTHLGRRRAWNIALGVRLGIAGALVVIPALPLPARLAWAGVTAVSSVALRLAAPARVRDWVDARLPMEAAAVAAILVVWGCAS